MEKQQEITTNSYHTEASIGDISWLIYKWRLETNPAMSAKWESLYETKTDYGFDGRAFVNQDSKQVVITFEGTQANTKDGNTWFSKDGFSDLQIGLGIIPTSVREGYEWFKATMTELEEKYGKDEYGYVVAGHSLGGGDAQLISGMYFLDTGKALPTLSEAGPGMLSQLKKYAVEQLMAGNKIYLPNGETAQLEGGFFSYFSRKSQADQLAESFQGTDFSNVVNLITVNDPVGNIGYNRDETKDHHVGTSIIVPHLLTPREDMQDTDYESSKEKMSKDPTTPNLPWVLSDFSNLHYSRFDRHQPEQSYAVWSGTTPGLLKDKPADPYDYSAPIKVWDGSTISMPENTIVGTEKDEVITGTMGDDLITGLTGHDVIFGGDGQDMLLGGNSNDSLSGGNSNDFITGDAGNDALYGDAGNDVLYGGDGNDILDGGLGSDLLSGGAGNDTLRWSGGNDLLCGNEGDDTFILGTTEETKVTGDVTIKWERNFADFGNDKVAIASNVSKGGDSHILFSFADEIKFSDMRFDQKGTDIIITDKKSASSVVFTDGLQSFANCSDMIDFKFTNGLLYKNDELYHVHAGTGNITGVADDAYSGNLLIGSAADDIITAGKGNDVIFGGTGKDLFYFDNLFGSDALVGSTSDDSIKFNMLFKAEDFSIHQNSNDLVIDYLGTQQELTINNWYSSSNAMNCFTFADNSSYKIENNHFVTL